MVCLRVRVRVRVLFGGAVCRDISLVRAECTRPRSGGGGTAAVLMQQVRQSLPPLDVQQLDFQGYLFREKWF